MTQSETLNRLYFITKLKLSTMKRGDTIMKALVFALLCLNLTACYESSPTPAIDSKSAEQPADIIAPVPDPTPKVETPAISPTPEVTPTPTPVPFVAPKSPIEAEQVFRGTYREVGKPDNFITINNNFTASGSVYTKTIDYVFLSGRKHFFDSVGTCTFTAQSYRVELAPEVLGGMFFRFILSSFSHSWGDRSGYDCVQGGTGTLHVVSWPSELCVKLRFDMSTGDKMYCKASL